MLSKAWLDQKTPSAVLKITLTAVCVLGMFFRFTFPGGLWDHVLFHFSHANVFHLGGNLLCLWLLRFRQRVWTSFAIATLCSLIPSPTWDWGSMSFEMMPTCGLSGYLLAVITLEVMRVSGEKVLVRYLLLPILVTGLMPNVNLLYHLYVIIVAYLVACIKTKS